MRLKSGVIILVLLAVAPGIVFGKSTNWVSALYPHIINSNHVEVTFLVNGPSPQSMAVVVQTNYDKAIADWRAELIKAHEKWMNESKTNTRAKFTPLRPGQSDFDNAKWIPFNTNLVLDLGPGDGRREVMFSYRYGIKDETNDISWNGSEILVQTMPPSVVFTNPPQRVTSQPVIQLQGYSLKPLNTIRYELMNENGAKVSGGEGIVNDQYVDQKSFEATTNFFTCYDVSLTPGTNTFVLHFTDVAENTLTTNFVVVLSAAGGTNPPVVSTPSHASQQPR